MSIIITPQPCGQNVFLPVCTNAIPFAHKLDKGILPAGTGWQLCGAKQPEQPLFRITGHLELPQIPDSQGLQSCPVLESLTPIKSSAPLELIPHKKGYAMAVITMSDKASQGQRVDTAGPLCMALLENCLPVAYAARFILPDEKIQLKGLLADLALNQKYDLICTCGGTGLTERDITPQVTSSLLDLELPGFMQTMMAASLAKTPRAPISRAVAGIIANCLVINLPGSKKAVEENLAPLLPALEHGLSKLNGDTGDCGMPC